GYHRYFAHKSFKTSRIFQFILAILGAAGGFRGPLWWASYHREHHRYADTELDIHSPSQNSFWYAHCGWFFNKNILNTDLSKVKSLAKFPELIFLNKYHYLLAPLQISILYYLGNAHLIGAYVNGVQCVIYGFFLSTFLVLHTIFFINSIAHLPGCGGYRRFHTRDMTRNNAWFSILSMGGSWHNNHHRYASTAKAGFYWWEIDLTYYIIKLFSFFSIVWDVRTVPNKIIEEGNIIKGR
ncbi:MAG: acyl-CoA desaturase, partial [Gammaproteobacteria bacterium]|nr:acyl-CoA desaturase [Gammaproteobacteria bacterium]